MWEVDREWYQTAKDLHFGLRLLSGLLIILLFTAYFVRNANAAVVQENYRYDGIVWGISDVEFVTGSNALNVRQGCIVNAPNAFSAACFAVGGNPSDLTAVQRAALSNSTSGGDFYTFSQRFANYGGSFELPDWELLNFYDLWSKYESLYGDALYAADFTQAQFAGAKADFQTVLGGGSIGGGTGSNDVPEFDNLRYMCTLETSPSFLTVGGNYQAYKMTGENSNGFTYDSSVTKTVSPYNYPNPYLYALNDSVIFERIQSKLDTGYDVIISFGSNNYFVYAIEHNCWLVNGTRLNITGGRTWYQFYAAVGQNNIFVYDDNLYVQTKLAVNFSPTTANDTSLGNVYYYVFEAGTTIGGGGSNNPVVPPTNWPDNPVVVAPEPPELPEPYNPIIDEQPIGPTPPQNPIYPPILNITEDTYTADLQGILDAMDAHCQHLRSALHTEMSNLWTAISTKMTNDFATFRTYMTGQIGWLGDLISDEMASTRDYLQDLFEWLAEQFEYTFTGTAYDDNTLISWLRKIYYRLGSGGVNTRPVDPVSNPVDAGDWLSQLIANLFTALNALAGGLLTSVGSALDLMHTKFPFSLPWDLLAILALFDASPIAPDFDVPIYTLGSAGQLVQVGAWEIDLSDFSPYLEGIRWMQKICFVYFLAVHTKDWMDTLEKVVA